METIQFYPLDISYKILENRPVIVLYGRTAEGNQIVIHDTGFEPYFYVIPKDGVNIGEKLEKIKIESEGEVHIITKTEATIKKLLGKEVFAIKVYTNLPSAVPVLREAVKDWDSIEEVHEYDIPFVRRYLIDRNITPMVLHECQGEFVNQKSRAHVLKTASVRQIGAETLHNPKVLAFDIETYSSPDFEIDADKNHIIMMSLYGEGFKKVIVWKRFSTSEDYIEFVENEAELIQKFKECIEAYKPDILTGYFSDGFDLPYIKTRAEKHGIKLDLGTDYSEARVRAGKDTSVSINGITHLDIFKFIRKVIGSSMDTYAYDLNSVASELLDEQKQDVQLAELSGVWDNNAQGLEKFCRYNLHDSYLTYSLAVKMLPTIIEMVKIVGVPIYDVNRMGFSQLVEWFILKQAQQFNELAPNKPGYNEIQQRRFHTYQGAFVYEPKPGLYKDIAVFDFRSLYPTILSSHNIGPDTLDCACCEGTQMTPSEEEKEKHWFCSKIKGFIPGLIEDLIKRRIRIKEIIKDEHDEKFAFLDARQNSLKLLANSFYGYLGFFGARWYSIECAR